MKDNKHSMGQALAIWGSILQLGPIAGLIGTIVGMMRAFSVLSAGGPDKDQALAESISFALWTTIAGMGISFIGLILLLIALTSTSYRSIWFRNVLWAMSILWLVSAPPIGTICGISLIWYLYTHNKEFAEQGGRA